MNLLDSGASAQAPRASALTQPSGPRSPSTGRRRPRRPCGAGRPEAPAFRRGAPLQLLQLTAHVAGFEPQGARATDLGVVGCARLSPVPGLA